MSERSPTAAERAARVVARVHASNHLDPQIAYVAAAIEAAEAAAESAAIERCARVAERTADESKWRWTGHMNGRKLSGPHALGVAIAAFIRALNDVPQTKGD